MCADGRAVSVGASLARRLACPEPLDHRRERVDAPHAEVGDAPALTARAAGDRRSRRACRSRGTATSSASAAVSPAIRSAIRGGRRGAVVGHDDGLDQRVELDGRRRGARRPSRMCATVRSMRSGSHRTSWCWPSSSVRPSIVKPTMSAWARGVRQRRASVDADEDREMGLERAASCARGRAGSARRRSVSVFSVEECVAGSRPTPPTGLCAPPADRTRHRSRGTR